jgi:hypothetical protein
MITIEINTQNQTGIIHSTIMDIQIEITVTVIMVTVTVIMITIEINTQNQTGIIHSTIMDIQIGIMMNTIKGTILIKGTDHQLQTCLYNVNKGISNGMIYIVNIEDNDEEERVRM